MRQNFFKETDDFVFCYTCEKYKCNVRNINALKIFKETDDFVFCFTCKKERCDAIKINASKPFQRN